MNSKQTAYQQGKFDNRNRLYFVIATIFILVLKFQVRHRNMESKLQGSEMCGGLGNCANCIFISLCYPETEENKPKLK